MHRFYVTQPLQAGKTIQLPAATARQCFRVLRLHPPEQIALFDGSGIEVIVTLKEVADKGASGVIESLSRPPVEPAVHVELLVALPGAEKWEWILQKCTELGVAQFQPIQTRRCVVRVSEAEWPKKAERWQAIIIEAAEQSGRTHIPRLLAPASFDGILRGGNPGVALHTRPGLPGLRQTVAVALSADRNRPIRLLIGPEGGLDEAEVAGLVSGGWAVASMGPRILRCETAAIAACVLAQSATDDMGCS